MDTGSGAADSCYGSYRGNNSRKESLVFNDQSWDLIGSTEEAIGNLQASTDGTWQYTGEVDASWDSYWLVVKQANRYAAWQFEIDQTSALAGTWQARWSPGSVTDFSHMEIYAGDFIPDVMPEEPSAEVPEPGSALLLGMGALGLLYARKRSR